MTAFDFSRLETDCGYRFVISSDEVLEAAVFIVYGLQFARLLSLPDRPNPFRPMLPQMAVRYRVLFFESCAEVLQQPEPVRFSGAIRNGDNAELYRAAFMPPRRAKASRPLIYGTFNFRAVPLSALRGTPKSVHSQVARDGCPKWY